MQKPIATPMTICCAVTSSPAAENGAMPAGAGTSGATRSATARESRIFTRAGMNGALKMGATMKQAAIRTNGQSSCVSRLSSCPGWRVIMAAADVS